MAKRKVHLPYNRFKVWLKDNGLTYAAISELLDITPTSVMLKINGLERCVCRNREPDAVRGC